MLLIGLLLVLSSTMASADSEPTRLLRFPDVSSDTVVFAYAGDLWTVERSGGTARRVTTHAGDELMPKLSPDGKWIAFTGEYDGNPDVYVIPAGGGEPHRLTFYPSFDMVLGWTPDGAKILFRSNRGIDLPFSSRFFLVSPEGGMPEVLPIPRGSLGSFSADSKQIAYNESSRELRTWKRYRGGWTSHIGIFDLEAVTYKELPKVDANEMFPMWHGDGIYFVSDRDGIMNIFRYDLGTEETRKLTDFTEYDVKWPSLGPDAIIFENGGELHLLDLAGETVSQVQATVPSEQLLARPQLVPVADLINSWSISPNGKRAVFGARGEVITVPAEHGSPRNLTGTPGVHELNPAWSPDGKLIAYLSDRTGEYELYVQPHKGGDEVRVTSDGHCYRYGPIWSPDSKKLLFWDKELKLWYIDIEEKQPVLVDTWKIRGIAGGAWSPDSRWIAYSMVEDNYNSSIRLYSLEQKKSFQVTDGFYGDTEPVFDPEGKYLFFASERHFHPATGRFDFHFNYYHTTALFAVTLQADQPSPFALRSDDEESEEDEENADDKGDDKDGDKKDKKKGDKGKKKGDDEEEEKGDADEVEPTKIDLEGIEQRVVSVEVPPGTYGDLSARKGKLYYLSIPFTVFQQGSEDGNGSLNATLHAYDLAEREDKVVLAGVDGYELDSEGKKLLYRSGQQYAIVDVASAKKGEGSLATGKMQVQVEPRAEWRQIFREAWRIERDFFWDPEMGGLDWQAIGKRYETLLPWVAHRSDLNYLIGEMIAELATSHAYVGGGKMPSRKRVGVGMLGADLVADGDLYRIDKIYRGESWSKRLRAPLAEPGLKAGEGDYLVAINGRPLRTPDNPYALLQNLAGEVVELSISHTADPEETEKILVKPTRNDIYLRYLDWVEQNRLKVEAATDGKIGYMHVPDTAVDGLIFFDKYLSSQLDKQGMIIDERYNAGGWPPSFFTDKLQRELLALVSPREGADIPWPPNAIFGPKVMLINEQAGSGGDAFPWFFKQLKISPLVGTRTWGGLVGLSRRVPLMDGGVVTAPEIGFWTTDNGGEWVAENYGVDPDYEVQQSPALVVKGHDPQLEKAIELALEALESYTPPGERPAYPRH
jgi:tricorn protease